MDYDFEFDRYVEDSEGFLVSIHDDESHWFQMLEDMLEDTGEHATFRKTYENGFFIDGDIRNREELQTLVREHRESSRTKRNTQEVTARFASLFNDKSSADIILSVNGTSYHAHCLILCLWSPVFRKMLEDSKGFASSLTTDTESHCDVLNLTESDGDLQVFDEFLKFFYTEMTTCNIKDIWHVVSLADKYNVVELFKSCSDVLIRYVKSIPFNEELIGILKGAQFWSMDDLQSEVWQIILRYIYFSLEGFLLLSLDIDTLCRILESSDLIVENEYKLLKKLVPFLEKLADENDTASLRKVIDLIRFTEMSFSQLKNLEQPTIAKFVRPNIKKALFHREEIITDSKGPRCYLRPALPYFEKQSKTLDDSFLENDKDWVTFHTLALHIPNLEDNKRYEHVSTTHTSSWCFVYHSEKHIQRLVLCASPTSTSIRKTGDNIRIKCRVPHRELKNAVNAIATMITVVHNEAKDSIHEVTSTKVHVRIDIDDGRITFRKKGFSISLKRVKSESMLYFSIFVMARL